MICAANQKERSPAPLTARRVKQALAATLRQYAAPIRRRLVRA